MKTLYDYHERATKTKTVRKNLYKKGYTDFAIKPGESIDNLFARFEKILSDLHDVNVIPADEDNTTKILRSLSSE